MTTLRAIGCPRRASGLHGVYPTTQTGCNRPGTMPIWARRGRHGSMPSMHQRGSLFPRPKRLGCSTRMPELVSLASESFRIQTPPSNLACQCPTEDCCCRRGAKAEVSTSSTRIPSRWPRNWSRLKIGCSTCLPRQWMESPIAWGPRHLDGIHP